MSSPNLDFSAQLPMWRAFIGGQSTVRAFNRAVLKSSQQGPQRSLLNCRALGLLSRDGSSRGMPERAEILPVGIALDHPATMVAAVVSSATIREKSRRYCWDSPMIFGLLSFSTFLWPATTKEGFSAAISSRLAIHCYPANYLLTFLRLGRPWLGGIRATAPMERKGSQHRCFRCVRDIHHCLASRIRTRFELARRSKRRVGSRAVLVVWSAE